MLGAGASTSARTSAGTSADTRTSTSVLVVPVHLLIFWDWIACNLLTLFLHIPPDGFLENRLSTFTS